MKKLTRYTLLFGILFTFSQSVFAWDYPLEAGLTFVWFDHQSGYSQDALDIKKNYTTDITTPEWDYSSGRNNPFAFIKSQSNRIVKAKFWHLHDDITSMHIEAEDYRDGFGPLPLTEVAFTINSGSGESGTESFTADGSVHFAVRKLNVKLKWKARKVNGVTLPNPINFASTIHDYYVLLAAPQAPMTEPWTEVLEYACDWAGGKSSTTSAATEIASSLYMSGFDYEDWGGYPRYGGFNSFNLTKFISELGNSYDVNCLDMGKAVATFGNAVGCGLGLSTYGHTANSENYIDGPLNCIDPIGVSEPTNNIFSSPLIDDDCRSGGFSYHAFSQMTSSNNVWDSTLQYDIDSDPDNVTGSNPGCGTATTGHTWKLPVNESESTYISRLVDSWPKWSYYSPTWNRNRSFSVF